MNYIIYRTDMEMADDIDHRTEPGEVTTISTRLLTDRKGIALLVNTRGYKVVIFEPHQVTVRKPVFYGTGGY